MWPDITNLRLREPRHSTHIRVAETGRHNTIKAFTQTCEETLIFLCMGLSRLGGEEPATGCSAFTSDRSDRA